jgi:DNA invertase Pin-like site-specific DNA recombinase
MKRVAIYLRVSTAKQDTANQLRELEAVAERSGWEVVRIYEDAGISGAKGRDKRPGLDTMMRAVNAKRFDMVAVWSVDRLGRSLTDLIGILQGLQDKGVDLFLQRVNAGLARARQNGTKLGRRRVKPSVEATIRELRAKGDGILKIARTLGVGTSVVQRVVLETARPCGERVDRRRASAPRESPSMSDWVRCWWRGCTT